MVMAPIRFASVRSRERPILLPKVSFRDDTSLLALRYEKTKAAEPPILITPRSHRRPSRPPSSFSFSPSTSGSTLVESTGDSPVVILPPHTPDARLTPPPTEEHPALRAAVLPRSTVPTDDSKRDSGHEASSLSISTPTIREEDCESDSLNFEEVDALANAAFVLAKAQLMKDEEDARRPLDEASVYSYSSDMDHQNTSTGAVQSGMGASGLAGHARSSCSMQTPPHPSQPITISSPHQSPVQPSVRPTSPSRRLVKSFSFRSMASVGRSRSSTKSNGGSTVAATSTCTTRTAATASTGTVSPARVPVSDLGGSVRGDGPLEPAAKSPSHRQSEPQPQPNLADDTRQAQQVQGEREEAGAGASSPQSRSLNSQRRSSSSPKKLTKSPPAPKPSFQSWMQSQFHARSPHDKAAAKSGSEDIDPFSPLSVSIPTDELLDDGFMNSLSFSNRGSVMFGGQRILPVDRTMEKSEPEPELEPKLEPEPVATTDAADVEDATVEPTGHEAQPDESFADSEAHTSADGDDTATTTNGDANGSVVLGKDHNSAVETDSSSRLTPTPTPGANTTSQTESLSQPDTAITDETAPSSQAPDAAVLRPRDKLSVPDVRVPPDDMEQESQKVRSLYAAPNEFRWEDGAPSASSEPLESTPEVPAEEELATDKEKKEIQSKLLEPGRRTPRSGTSSLQVPEPRRDTELAGGIEDWEDVDGAQVDRYGFITIPRPGSRIGTPTDLKSAQFSPRRRNVLQKRDGPGYASSLGPRRQPSRKVSARSLNTQHSNLSTTSLRSSRSVFRQAGNLLPHNRHRRWMDEAGEMLTVSPSLQDLAEEAKADRIAENLKRKEWERSEKWRKMAKVINKGAQGQGMEFEFDVKNPKLIERTWKGVPDRWRTAAWWSFMAAAAKERKGSPSAERIIEDFYRLQDRMSPDDVQIDLDVPRTINRHIMFRRRYRGGQRLLFRVLHAISIYFPKTGYVQGMASLAATLLCYFDEEKCFVMMVRMWQLRGLDRLYQPGFDGLMEGLEEFRGSWLNKDVSEKLTELCVDPTAYGTRWYLTLFNLSIPFPAQLRVWDVYLLLGNDSAKETPGSSQQAAAAGNAKGSTAPHGLDVLHATSAALIQALREVLLDSDFENAMKALTSWIPIKDEDLLMKVTKAEWKTHHGKKKS